MRIEKGIQYVTISAYHGYSPTQVTAAANLQTVLEMSTNNTYDCSSSLVLRSENYKNILPATGITNIPLGVKKPGENMVGLCSMGMYSFTINFI